MNLPKNYKKIIDEAVDKKWHFLAKRTDAPVLPLIYKFEVLQTIECQRLYKTKIPSIAFWDGPDFHLYFHSKEYKTTIESATKLFFSGKSETHIKKLVNLCNKAIEKSKLLDKHNLQRLQSTNLLALHNEIVNYYARSFLYGYITWCAQVLQNSALKIIKSRAKEIAQLGMEESAIFSILTKPETESAYIQKETELDNLSIKFKEKLKQIKSYSEAKIRKRLPKLDGAIKKFLERFGWVGYDYGGPAISYQEVISAILEHKQKEKDKTPSKEEVIRVCQLTPAEQKIFRVFSLISYTKDQRNSTDDFVHFSLDKLYREVGRRHGFTGREVRYLWPEEFADLLKGKKTYDKNYLKEKMQYCSANLLFKDRAKRYIVGRENKKIIEKQLKESIIKKADIFEIKGTVASSGLVKGTAKIIETFEEIDKVKEGDILVTHMTSPRFMSAIRRCGAIVTDEGGLTSHAAIISRELKKPCVVGTKIATQVLTDGDRIEVDADKGIIRRIK